MASSQNDRCAAYWDRRFGSAELRGSLLHSAITTPASPPPWRALVIIALALVASAWLVVTTLSRLLQVLL